MRWFRVDNRLVHGQVIEAWLPYTGARHLVVVNDDLAVDPLRQQIIGLAVPQRLLTHFIPMRKLLGVLDSHVEEAMFVLLEHCRDAAQAHELGVPMETLNVGNLHYADGKRQLLPHVAVSVEDEGILRGLAAQGVHLDFRSVPAENTRGLDESFF